MLDGIDVAQPNDLLSFEIDDLGLEEANGLCKHELKT